MSNTYKVIIATIAIAILGATSIFLVGQNREQKVITTQSPFVVSSVKSQVVSSSSQSQILSSSSIVTQISVANSVKTESQVVKNTIPTFDSRYQTSLKLTTPNEITLISIGECDLQTKFKTGLCKILDQNKNVIFLFNSWIGKPLLIDSTKESITILNISQPYISCSISKYQFSYANKELNTVLNLNSPECNDLNVTNEIQKYKSAYDKINNFDN